MFIRGAAIRPVPSWAVVERTTLERVEEQIAQLSDQDDTQTLDQAFERFEKSQPVLADRMNEILARPLDNTALALGYFLSIAIWLAFEEQFPGRVGAVTADSLEATDASLKLEEELRAKLPSETLEVDDVVACAQPGLMAFVNNHIETALDTVLEGEPARNEVQQRHSAESALVDIDDVHLVYRSLLVLALALSHAVRPPHGEEVRGGTEMLA